jgi:hypothetical protein
MQALLEGPIREAAVVMVKRPSSGFDLVPAVLDRHNRLSAAQVKTD